MQHSCLNASYRKTATRRSLAILNNAATTPSCDRDKQSRFRSLRASYYEQRLPACANGDMTQSAAGMFREKWHKRKHGISSGGVAAPQRRRNAKTYNRNVSNSSRVTDIGGKQRVTALLVHAYSAFCADAARQHCAAMRLPSCACLAARYTAPWRAPQQRVSGSSSLLALLLFSRATCFLRVAHALPLSPCAFRRMRNAAPQHQHLFHARLNMRCAPLANVHRQDV